MSYGKKSRGEIVKEINKIKIYYSKYRGYSLWSPSGLYLGSPFDLKHAEELCRGNLAYVFE